MSTSFALAGVTAVLEYMLNNGLGVPVVTGAAGEKVTVTAMPPDLIDLTLTNSMPQINLFLHQVSPNAAWRNRGLPSRDAAGDRVTNPPLAIDLHYFLTAYGTADLEAEVLLGYALEVLHETPVLSRDIIRAALNGPGTSTTSVSYQNPLETVGLADQVEQLKVSPFPLNTEEMSRFWTAMQAHYRPTFSFQVTVVLIQAARPARAPLPVLATNVTVQTGLVPKVPVADSAAPPNGQTGALVGDTVIISGHGLSDPAPLIQMVNAKFAISETFAAAGGGTDDAVTFAVPVTLPSDPTSSWPVGVYQVRVILLAGQPKQVATNALPLVIAPAITTALPMSVARVAGQVTVKLNTSPPIRQEQSVFIVLGGTEVPVVPLTATTSSITAVTTVDPGTYLVRARVDGIDSFIVDRSKTPPTYLPKTLTVT